jgi:hypothetical protein
MTAARRAHVTRLLHDHGPLAPPELRSWVAAERLRSHERGEWRRAFGVRLALAGAVAAPLVVAAIVIPGLFEGGEPGVDDAHAIASRAATDPPPTRREGDPTQLAAQMAGVRFPDWKREFGWQAIGQRADALDGRDTRTVFYEHEGHRIGYTIVSGDPLDAPGDAATRRVDGVDLRVWRDRHGHDIVAFERHGRTCVLSGHVEHRSTLVELASWKGDGKVTF